jgi:type IV secretory pathway ATPase VirB11/archaellum biosynthesis ATPase
MVCDYEMIDSIMKINCANCMFASSVEDFDVCFAQVIDKILEAKKVERVILGEAREYEYDFEQTKFLVEIANVYDKLVNKDRILDYSKLGRERCQKCFSKRFTDLEFIVTEMIRKDPIGAYVKVKRMIRLGLLRANKEKPICRRCYKFYVENALIPIKEALEKTSIIQIVKDKLHGYKLGDRSLYRKIFHPLIRPNFMLTRYTMMPPKGAKPIDRYTLPGNILVEIFKVPGKVRYFYYVTPPEFKLSDEKYTILEEARRYLAEHRPSETESTRPEKARETFMNIGRDMIRELTMGRGMKLGGNELEEMANILARYTAGFGILEVLLADENIQDVYVNSPIGLMPIFIGHGDFEECETNLIPTREDAESWATRFRMLSGRPLDEANPVLDTELFVPGGRARVCAITRTLSPEGIGYALRRHRDKPWTYPLFMDVKFFNDLFAGLMSFLVDGSRAILIAGGRSSGKTSLLGATMIEIMKKFRIVTAEDTLELPVTQLRNLGYNIERLKSRSVITRVEAEMPAEEALRTALRLGDSCMILGEVRSMEAKALYEAMRIGALAHVVAGTIHGESAYGVFDRVVNDLGVPPTSFKATDIIVVCGMLKSADGLHRYRRVLEVTEVKKHWQTDPVDEGGFVNLMEYSAKEDKLMPTSTLINGESFIINEIAKRVREWHGNWDAVWSNIELRGKVKQAMVDYANKLNRKDILEANWVSRSNGMFHTISDEVRGEIGKLDSKEIFKRWDDWFKKELRGK